MNKKITFQEALLTAVGLVIGSGIFFRAATILKLTKENVSVAIIGWIVLGFTLIFAGIGLSILAARSKREGGIVGYMEDCYGKTAAFLTGWFTTFIYIPTLIGILGIVAAGFLLQLVGVEKTALSVQGTAGVLIVIVYTWNYFSTKFAALFSSAATIIKLLPIVIIGVIGMANFNTTTVSEGFSTFTPSLFVAPLLSMAFAFDGWTTVATLSRDMENPQKDIAKVLAINAIIVTAAYTLYFTGVTMLMPAKDIVEAGNDHVGMIASNVLGGNFGKSFILFCVVMSVLGTLNGNIMGAFRYPHALAQANDLPNSEFFVQESKYGTTANASYISVIPIIGWFTLYTIQAFAGEARAKFVDADAVLSKLQGDELDAAKSVHMFGGISFDDIPIMTIAAVIVILLIAAMKYGMKEGVGVIKAVIAPIIGIIGQGYVILSFIQTNDSWLTYMIICVIIVGIGFAIRSQVKKKQVA